MLQSNPTWEDTVDDSPSWDETSEDVQEYPNFDRELENQRLGAALYGSRTDPDMEFARALYQQVPAKIGVGLHAAMQPVERLMRPVFQQVREAMNPSNIALTGEALPEL